MKPVTTRIPEDDEALLRELEQEMSADRAEVLRRLIRDGLRDWRKKRALQALETHEITLRTAAERAGVSYVEMLAMATDEGIDVGYGDEDLEHDLRRL